MIAVISMVSESSKPFIDTAILSAIEWNHGSRIYIAYETENCSQELIERLKDWELANNKVILVPAEKRPWPTVAHAHNDALKEALADEDNKYFARLDLDNYFLDHSLKVLRDALVSKGVDMVYGDNLKCVWRGEWVIWGCSIAPPTVYAGELIRELNKIPGNSIMYTRELAEKVGFWNVEYEGGWDVEFYVRALVHGFTLEKVIDGIIPIEVTRYHRDSAFAQSKRGETFEETRWYKWRKRLWENRAFYRQIQVRRMFGGGSQLC